ncbi:DUF4279 domain-containing protein [Psychrobacillus sp. L3]|uniref:DUF4279 domain-containing protein n=1 Tax=Psychrobacillus sp. L3 TaxID=3236891 RepID=UPI0036F2DD4A
MEKTRVQAYFSLSNDDDFPLDEVTKRLNIQPSRTTKVGEPLPLNSARHYFSTTWQYGLGYKETLDVDEVLMPVIDKLESKVIDILLLKKDYNLVAKFYIVIEINNGRTPGLAIYTRASKLATEIDAVFDIDLYAYPYNELDEV